jgi:hypothetical protein
MVKFNITKERKYLLIAGSVLLLLGVLYRFSPTIQDLKPAGSENVLKKKKILKFRNKVLKKDSLQSQLMALNRNLERGEFGLLSGTTPALSAVEIQNALNGISEKIDINMETMRVLKPVDLEKMEYLSVPVQFSFKSTIRQLKELLYQIESSPKILTVTQMRIRRIRTDPEHIDSTITVSGFFKKEKE